eukprot:515590-Rhodomonas_salina.1
MDASSSHPGAAAQVRSRHRVRSPQTGLYIPSSPYFKSPFFHPLTLLVTHLLTYLLTYLLPRSFSCELITLAPVATSRRYTACRTPWQR